MVSSICIVSVEICCFQQLNRHCVFRRGRFWGGGRPAGRAGAGSPSSGLRSVPHGARLPEGSSSSAPRPDQGHTRPGERREAAAGPGGAGREGRRRPEESRAGGVRVWVVRVPGAGAESCWGQAERPGRQTPALSAREWGVSTESSGLVNLISCQNSHGNEPRPAELAEQPGPGLPAPFMSGRLCCAGTGRAGARRGRGSGPGRRLWLRSLGSCSFPSLPCSSLAAVTGVVCVWIFVALAGFPPHSGFLALKIREERRNCY